MRKLRITRSAQKTIEALLKQSPKQANLIADSIQALLKNPAPNNARKLTGYPCYRYRVGGYRIVYEYDDDATTIYITVIATRDQVYQITQRRYKK